MIVGTEWLVEAEGCNQESLRDEPALRAVFAQIVDDLGLKVIDSVWHKFQGEGGVTGMSALTESHLACHTYPEHKIATFNLYCCRTRPEWDWENNLRDAIGAERVNIQKIERGTKCNANDPSLIAGSVSLAGGKTRLECETHSGQPPGRMAAQVI